MPTWFVTKNKWMHEESIVGFCSRSYKDILQFIQVLTTINLKVVIMYLGIAISKGNETTTSGCKTGGMWSFFSLTYCKIWFITSRKAVSKAAWRLCLSSIIGSAYHIDTAGVEKASPIIQNMSNTQVIGQPNLQTRTTKIIVITWVLSPNMQLRKIIKNSLTEIKVIMVIKRRLTSSVNWLWTVIKGFSLRRCRRDDIELNEPLFPI